MRNIDSASYGGFTDDIVVEWLGEFESDGRPQITRLVGVLKDFKEFAEQYRKTVFQLAKEEQAGKKDLTEAMDEQINKALDEQINKALDVYWAPLSQIASQYVAGPYARQLLSDELEKRIGEYLEKIKEMVGDKPTLKLPGVLVFFDELTLIRYYPYSDVALVSLPYRVFKKATAPENDKEKSSSIAHELGHYLYWHMAEFGHLDKQHERVMEDLRRDFEKRRMAEDWLFVGRWVEEIFADVVGAWIGEESFLESGNKRIRASAALDRDSWTENDNEHVPDILRPFVTTYTLEKKNKVEDGTAKWKEFLASAASSHKDFRISAQDSETVPIWGLFLSKEPRKKAPEELIPALRLIVEYLLDGMDKFRKGEPGGPFEFVFTPGGGKGIEVLKARAQKIAQADKQQAEEQRDVQAMEAAQAYRILLDPVVIEAEQSGTKHKHSYVVISPHYHKGSLKPHRHT